LLNVVKNSPSSEVNGGGHNHKTEKVMMIR